MDELRDAVWRHAAGLVLTDELPDIAASALVRGVDSAALRELAGLNRSSDTQEILDRYRAALAELSHEQVAGARAELLTAAEAIMNEPVD